MAKTKKPQSIRVATCQFSVEPEIAQRNEGVVLAPSEAITLAWVGPLRLERTNTHAARRRGCILSGSSGWRYEGGAGRGSDGAGGVGGVPGREQR